MSRYRVMSMNILLVTALLMAPVTLVFTGSVRAEEKKQKTELNKKMETIDDGMKKLKRTLKKSDQNPASIKLIDGIIEAATASKELVPTKAGKLSDADKKKLVEDYQQSMTKLIDTMGQMKKAVEADDNAKALELHKSLKGQEEDGHDKFIESDDKDASGKDKEKSEK